MLRNRNEQDRDRIWKMKSMHVVGQKTKVNSSSANPYKISIHS
jgi:hypothetical protein